MGIFDFVRGAGEDVGLAEAAENERLDELREGNKLLRFIQEAQLGIESPKVTFDDGVATVWGKAPSQAVKENTILAIGNCAGVERVEDHIEVESPAPESTFYTVKSGDTLGAIAKEHLGSASRYPEIFEANRPMLKDPDKIYPGQVLRIPEA
jgi:hypothetical protein